MNSKISLLFIIISISIQGCSGCSKSGRKQQMSVPVESGRNLDRNELPSDGKTVIKMVEKHGVFEVPVEVNGINMYFIFDTGASDVTMSLTEASFLYKQGSLSDEDILGTKDYQIADGSISEGTIVNLKTIRIGNRTLKNVRASIMNNMQAPLLFGQSALGQFGKVTIDYKRHEISFE